MWVYVCKCKLSINNILFLAHRAGLPGGLAVKNPPGNAGHIWSMG